MPGVAAVIARSRWGSNSERAAGTAPYQRHRPEHTLHYQIVEQYYPALVAHMAEQERPLPEYVKREFEDYLKEVEAGRGETLYDPRLMITSGPGYKAVEHKAEE